MGLISKFEKTTKVTTVLLEIIIYHLTFIVSFLLRYKGEIPSFNYRAYEGVFLYIMISFVVLNMLSGLYVFYNKRKIDIFYLTIINQFLMAIIVTSLTFFGRWFAFPRTIILINFVVSTVILFIFRIGIYILYRKVSGLEKIMVVGLEENCRRAIRNFEESKNRLYQVDYAVTGNYIKNVKEHLDEVDIVYVTENIQGDQYIKLIDLLKENNKDIFLSSQFENLQVLNSKILNIEDEAFLKIVSFNIPPEMDILKRAIDIIISLILLVITGPLTLVTAILVKMSSPGPVFYKQIRITENQKEFNILKFRTMSATAEKETGPILATANDARVTPLGKYLRSLRIDELPQLLNVLKGEMSLVGPRPERPFFVEQFQGLNPNYRFRHNVRAGITGYAQVNGKYTTDFNSKLNFDLLYIKQYSPFLDLQILVQTIKTLFDKMSSQGIDEESEESVYQIPSRIKVYN